MGFGEAVKFGSQESTTKQQWYFEYDGWMEKKDGTSTIDLEPSAGSMKGPYLISLKTGNFKGAGTDADIMVQLFGSSASMKQPEKLCRSLTNSNPFERDQVPISAKTCPTA